MQSKFSEPLRYNKRLYGRRRLSFFIFLLILVMPSGQALSTFSQIRNPNEHPSHQSQPILEVILFCSGMCPEYGNKVSLRIYEDRMAEYLEIYSNYPVPHANDKVQLKKSLMLNAEEFKELINLAEPAKMLGDKTEYYLGYIGPDAIWSRVVIYRNEDKNKTIFLYYLNPRDRKPIDVPPDWLKEIIERTGNLGSNIKKTN